MWTWPPDCAPLRRLEIADDKGETSQRLQWLFCSEPYFISKGNLHTGREQAAKFKTLGYLSCRCNIIQKITVISLLGLFHQQDTQEM